MSIRIPFLFVVCATLGATSLTSLGAEFALVPKGATGAHNIAGQEITLDGPNQQVTVHMELSGWDPDTNNDPLLGAFQGSIAPTGYSSGTGVDLNPLGWPGTPSDGAFQALNLCTVNQVPDPSGIPCISAPDCPQNEFCIPNQRWVFNGLSYINAVSTASLQYEYVASAQAGGKADDGGTFYLGTLIVEVPSGASGTYTIAFDASPTATFLQDDGAVPITPITTVPLLITVLCQSNADCDDSNACTDDTCLGDGTCENVNNYNDQIDCCNPITGQLTPIDDGNACTSTFCDVQTGEVIPTCLPEGTLCGNPAQNTCDAQDTCDGNCTCVDRKAPAGTACGNGSDTDCTDPDTCDGSGACQPNHAPVGSPCNDQSDTTCTDPDTCNAFGACLANHAPNGTTCDDGAFCTTGEACASGICTGGSATCNDGVGCTDDSCDEQNDICTNDPNDANCNNGQFCDGIEICDAVQDCVIQAGSVPDCNDGVGCTVDSCDELNDECDNNPNNGLCDNGQFCDGFETCDALLDCQPGVDPDCNDNIDCTDDSCDEVNDTCVNDPNDGLCPDDTLFCNGSEICVGGVGCDHTGSPCGGPCDEDNDICLCDAPLVTAAGSRYLAVSLQPAASDIPQAIVVKGACTGGVARYVGAPVPFYNEGAPGHGPLSMAGLLVDDPADAVFLTPAEWGDPVYVIGETLAPGSTYDVWADCGSPGNPGFSESNRALTYRFGDVDNNTLQNVNDVFFILLAFKGEFLLQPAVTRSRTDVHDCVPNRLININDAVVSILAFQGKTHADLGCINECPPCHPADCDDDNACTDDSCVIEDGTCLNIPNFVQGTTCCDPDTGETTVIDDGDPCTFDGCNAATGEVVHNPQVCDDGDDCTLDECIGGTCVFTPFTDIPCDSSADCPQTSPGCFGQNHCTCPGTAAPLVEFIPVGSTGPSTVVDNEIFIPQGGVDVTLDLFVSDWAPNELGVIQATLSEASLTSGDAGSLFPEQTPTPSAGAFIDTLRPNFVFGDPFTEEDRIVVVSRQTNPFQYAWGVVLTPPGAGQADPAVPQYLGTLVLQVSPDAAGTFTIEFAPGFQETLMSDQNRIPLPLITLESASIIITGS